MINVGEQFVASYLQYIRGCEFIQTNLYTVDSQGEIDVVGINLREKKVYVCEVAVHLTTGLQYVKDRRPNNVQKLTDKFSRDIAYANNYLAEYEKHFMLWSPVVKQGAGSAVYDQSAHLTAIANNIRHAHGVEIEFIVNGKFRACLAELRTFARKTTADIKCPVTRLLQIEEHLERHLSKTTAA
jgi:hypothetical protein